MATKKTGSLKGVDVVLVTSVNLAADVGASVLPVANGGNGTGSFTDGQILIGQTAGNTLAKASMSGGATMTAGGVVSVITNANMTGPITSVGNSTSIASQTGTGTKFVVDTSPTLITPVLGVASATSISLSGLTRDYFPIVENGTKTLIDGPIFTNNLGGSPNHLGVGTTSPDKIGYDPGASILCLQSTASSKVSNLTLVGKTTSTTGQVGAVDFYNDYSGTLHRLGKIYVDNNGTIGVGKFSIDLVASTVDAAAMTLTSVASFSTTLIELKKATSAPSLACPTFSSAGAIGITPAANNPYVVNLSGASGVYQINAQAADAIACYDVSALAAGTGGGMYFGGNYTGSTTTTWAAIRGPKENSTDGQYGGYLSFLTRAHGASHAEVMQLTSAGVTIVRGPLTLKGYTVAGLPTGVVGHLAYVTDALAPAYGVALVGGGAITTMAFYNGAAWVAH